MYELHQGDCLEIMKKIEPGSVDMVLTDIGASEPHKSGRDQGPAMDAPATGAFPEREGGEG